MEEFGRRGGWGVNSKGGRKGKKEKEEKKGTKWPKSTSKSVTGTRTRAREIEGPRKRGHGTVNGVRTGVAEASPPSGPSAPEKRVNIDPFFYLSHPPGFSPSLFFLPPVAGIAARRGASATETELVCFYSNSLPRPLVLVRSFVSRFRPSVHPSVRSSVRVSVCSLVRYKSAAPTAHPFAIAARLYTMQHPTRKDSQREVRESENRARVPELRVFSLDGEWRTAVHGSSSDWRSKSKPLLASLIPLKINFERRGA